MKNKFAMKKLHFIFLFSGFMIQAMDQNLQYSFSKDITYICPNTAIEKLHKNSDISLKEWAALNKEIIIFSPEDINEIALQILPPNKFYNLDFSVDKNKNQIAILYRCISSRDNTCQLTIFSNEDKQILFTDSFYDSSLSMRDFNFDYHKVAFTVNNDPFLFIATINRDNKSKTIAQYPLPFSLTNVSCAFDKEAKKFIIQLLDQEKNIQQIWNDVKTDENKTFNQLAEEINALIRWGECFIIDLE